MLLFKCHLQDEADYTCQKNLTHYMSVSSTTCIQLKVCDKKKSTSKSYPSLIFLFFSEAHWRMWCLMASKINQIKNISWENETITLTMKWRISSVLIYHFVQNAKNSNCKLCDFQKIPLTLYKISPYAMLEEQNTSNLIESPGKHFGNPIKSFSCLFKVS